MFQYDNTQPGSIFIGKRIYENAKVTDALKMFENVPSVTVNTTATSTLTNTNVNSIQVNRGS